MNGPRDYHAKRRKSKRKTNTQPYPVLLICGILKKKKKCWYIFHFTPEQRSLCNLHYGYQVSLPRTSKLMKRHDKWKGGKRAGREMSQCVAGKEWGSLVHQAAGSRRWVNPPRLLTHLGTVLGLGCSHEEFQHWLGLRDQRGHRVDDCSEFGGGL